MSTVNRHRVAIVGCGMIADQHAEQIRYVPNCELVAACDTEELMARQLADRFHIPAVFTDAGEMVRSASIDVVHITTPAQSHFALGELCLKAGCHVYMEKPFTVNRAEARALIDLARSVGRRITVGHNLQFSPETLRMRELIQSGALGGRPVHVESIQSYTHEEPTYGRAVLGDRNHWVRRLPGSLPQNLISHGVAKLAEFLEGEAPELLSMSFSSPYLLERGHGDIVDEIRALMRDERGTTAFFLFTTQFVGGANELRLFGKTGSIAVNNTNRSVVPARPSTHKSYLRYFLEPLTHAREYGRNTFISLRQFRRKEFHMDFGMRKLIALFYRAIREAGEDPIPTDQILRTASIMDAIFDQMKSSPGLPATERVMVSRP